MLRRQKDTFIAAQRRFQRVHGRLAADHERNHHERKNNDVPDWNHRQLGLLVFFLCRHKPRGDGKRYPAFSNGSWISFFSTISLVMVSSRCSFCCGSWYIRSSINSSRMIRRPRAPTLRLMASRATASRASSENFNLTFSYSNSRWYCLTSAFLGRVKISTRAA